MKRPPRVWRGPCRPPGTRWPGRAGVTYSAAHTARDGVALPVTHPFAPVGDGGPLAQLVGDRSCPARRDGPSCGASCGRRRALILVVPAERVVPQAAVDRPEGWLCRPPPRSERPGHDAALDPHPGGRCRFPYQAGPPAPSAGDRPTRAGAAALCAGSCRGRCTRPVAPHPARHRAVPPVRADLARHRGLVPADKAGRSRPPPHGSSSGP